jgi:hypothetical protein
MRLVGDSFAQSDSAALAAILGKISLAVQSETDEVRFSGYGTMARSRGSQTAAGERAGFYILDRWVSDDGERFYSLAISPVTSANGG